MSVIVAFAAGLLLASPFARAVPPSPAPAPSSTAVDMNLPGPPPLRNRLERRTWASRWRRGLA
jgi:hypothetical protein